MLVETAALTLLLLLLLLLFLPARSQILEMVAKSVNEKTDKIDRAVAGGDVRTVWKEAHALKGSASQCALEALSAAARDVEALFKSLDPAPGEAPKWPGCVDVPAAKRLVDTLRHEGARVVATAARLAAQQH